MNAAKKKILESVGCIVASTQEYLRAIEVESEFWPKISQTCKTLEQSLFQPGDSEEAAESALSLPSPNTAM